MASATSASSTTATALRAGCLLSDQMTPERRREIFRTIDQRWHFEQCYYLRYQDVDAKAIIEEFFEGTWLMTSKQHQEERDDRWHPFDLLLVP